MVPQFDLFGEPIQPKTTSIPVVTRTEFHGEKVRIVTINKEPWWVLSDVAKVLGYRDARDAGRNVRDRQKGTHILRTPGGDQEMTIVSEGGLYRLIMKSRSPVADEFQDWVCDEVIPTIRRTGSYKITTDRIEKTQRRLKSSRHTATLRVKNADANTAMHAKTFDDGGGVPDVAAIHNAVYRGQFSGHTAATLRQALGLKPYQTPLDRMSDVCLATNLLSKVLADRSVQEQDTPLEDRPALYQRMADDLSRQTLRQLGDDRRLGFREDPKRGRILDVLDVA